MMRLASRFKSLPLCLALLIAPGILPAQVPSSKEPQAAKKDDRKNDEVVIDWLKKNAIPIKSVEAGNGFVDLQPLKRILADTRVVGLGEATHGTREFFQFKHRMVEFLVREMNFNVFAIESNYASCLKVNDYVTGGKASRVDALQNLGMSVWVTEEMMALLDWLRAYNQTAPPERKVRFYGFDMQYAEVFEALPEYILRVAPEKAQELTETLTKLREAKQAARGGAKENLKALLPEVDKLIRYFILQEANFINKTSRAEYEQNLRSLRLALQDADVLLSKEYDEARDRYMAENILYLLNREPAATRIAVWAHNYHISTGEIPSPGGSVGKWMGAHLRQKLSGGYYALGFTFNEGSFQATSTNASGETQFVEYTVGPAGEGSLNWYFAQPKIEIYMIDFRHTPNNEIVQQWLTTPRGLGSQGGYNIPADYKERWADGGKTFQWATLSKEYDGMVFIERTKRARPLSR